MNKEIYDNFINPVHPTAFSSPGNIRRHNNNFGRNEILQTLKSVDSYTLHREFHKPRYRNPYFIYKKRQQIQMDLIDVSQLSRDNDGITFLLVAIDVFTKRAWVRPLKRKNAEQTLWGIKSIFTVMGDQLPKSVLFDKGKEFTNRQVNRYLQSQGVKIIHPNSEIKASVAERFNRTIQRILYSYLTENETYSYLPMLQALVAAYNGRKHRTLQHKFTPHEADREENQQEVLNAHNEHYSKIVRKRKKPKYVVGQTVRIKSLAPRFQRGYHEGFLREHFVITKVLNRMPIPTYLIKSLNDNQDIEGAFYAEELQPIEGNVFKIQVLKKRKLKNGKLQLFVKWQGFDDSHNSWIDADTVTQEY
jgi:Integrase core domain/Chromo (CHRromatin Organisation MOdifier) domain